MNVAGAGGPVRQHAVAFNSLAVGHGSVRSRLYWIWPWGASHLIPSSRDACFSARGCLLVPDTAGNRECAIVQRASGRTGGQRGPVVGRKHCAPPKSPRKNSKHARLGMVNEIQSVPAEPRPPAVPPTRYMTRRRLEIPTWSISFYGRFAVQRDAGQAEIRSFELASEQASLYSSLSDVLTVSSDRTAHLTNPADRDSLEFSPRGGHCDSVQPAYPATEETIHPGAHTLRGHRKQSLPFGGGRMPGARLSGLLRLTAPTLVVMFQVYNI